MTGSQYGGINGLTFAQIGNNALKWETVVSSNIGVDFSLFDRLRGSFDVYKRNTEDLFFPTPTVIAKSPCFLALNKSYFNSRSKPEF